MRLDPNRGNHIAPLTPLALNFYNNDWQYDLATSTSGSGPNIDVYLTDRTYACSHFCTGCDTHSYTPTPAPSPHSPMPTRSRSYSFTNTCSDHCTY